MLKAMKSLFIEEDGISSVEYAVLLAFIVAALITAVGLLRNQVIAAFNGACQELNNNTAC